MKIKQEDDTEIDVSMFNDYTFQLEQDGVYVTIGKQGAAKLIKVLQEWVDEKTKEGDPS